MRLESKELVGDVGKSRSAVGDVTVERRRLDGNGLVLVRKDGDRRRKGLLAPAVAAGSSTASRAVGVLFDSVLKSCERLVWARTCLLWGGVEVDFACGRLWLLL